MDFPVCSFREFAYRKSAPNTMYTRSTDFGAVTNTRCLLFQPKLIDNKRNKDFVDGNSKYVKKYGLV